MIKLWKLKPKISADLSHHYTDYDGLLAQLLYNRGLTEPHQIQEFLNPQYERLNSPFLFKDMQKAVERIWQAIEKNQKITIYGDYDADAVTANAVLRQTFRHLNHQNVNSYIPDRFSEGYGVNLEALQKIKGEGSGLIITVDCGTNSIDAAEWCKKNNIDLIITDHHEIIGELPQAYALINPKNSNDGYPDANITGVGVAFKMACGILSKKDKVAPRLANARSGQPATYAAGWEKWLLDLVAIGTVADCHELLGENRTLVKYGLMVLAKTKWTGLYALMQSAGLLEDGLLGKPQKTVFSRVPDTYTLGFIIAPRLNATGRLEHADASLSLLLETDADQAKLKAGQLEEVNRRRQDITARILSEAREQALLVKERKVIVMMNADWHQGVVGLVAGKLAEEFYKPTFVLSLKGGEATGSARTVGEFNVVEALRYSSAHLIRFGGHKAAAGLTLRPESFELFYRSVLDYAEGNLSDGELSPVMHLEAELSSEQLSINNYQLLRELEPFGAGNPRPKFLIKNASVISQRAVGASGQHLQMQIKVGEKTIPAIAFNFRPVDLSQNLDIACELMEDGWNGRKQLKLKIVDVKQVN
ncbi:MAG: single-stranded-DNA-specific exonuclease RecJ [Patescibacteria group bacterium]